MINIRNPRVAAAAWLPLLTTSLLASVAPAAPVWQGHEGAEDGILTIYNPAEPVSAAVTVQPKAQWRIGGEDDPAETLFGLVTDARRKPDGTTYLLDAVMSTVYEVAPDGEVRRTIGREGDGPGEFRNSESLALLADDGIGVLERMPSRLVVLGPDGTPRSGIDIGDGGGGHANVERLEVVRDGLVIGMFSMDMGQDGIEIRRTLGHFASDGALRDVILQTKEHQTGSSISISGGGDNDFVGQWCAAADGSVAVYQRTTPYLIEVFGPDGKAERRIRREYERLRRPEEELAAARQQREDMRARFSGSVEMEIEEMARDIEQVVCRPDGAMWVLTSRGSRECPTGCIGVFDVIDSQGRFTGQLKIEADFSADDDNFVIRGNHLYVLKEARNAPDRTFTSGGAGGGMMMMQISSGGGSSDDEDLDQEQKPYEVICYELPDGI